MSKTAFLFPGQGAQYVGMGRELYDALPQARQVYQAAGDILGYDLARLCFEGPADKLDSTVHSQPALFVTSMAALTYIRSTDPEVVETCQITAGLSLGEYTALTFAGSVDFPTGLRLVAERGRAMQSAADEAASGMVSILGLDVDLVEELCDLARQDSVLQIANLLCPGNTVVSGHKEACKRVTHLAEQRGAMRVVPLPVAGAFHTPLMAPAQERLKCALEQVEFGRPKMPVVCNFDAMPHDDPAHVRRLLLDQLVSPVQWEASVRRMISDFGIERFFEVGPGRVLKSLLKRIDRRITCENVGS